MRLEKNVNYIDLFAGAGGLSEGFVKSGYNPVAHVEMNIHACETLKTRICYHYLKNTDEYEVYLNYLKGDISKDQLYSYAPKELLESVINEEINETTISHIFEKIDSLLKEGKEKKVDLILGGPPCQAYSLVGRAVDKNGMKDDKRNFLYKQYLKFLKKYEPQHFVFENVPGILNANGGKILKKIIIGFSELGYSVKYKVLNSYDFGVLQNRKRVIIIGNKGKMQPYPKHDTIRTNHLVNDILSDLPALNPGGGSKEYATTPSSYMQKNDLRNEQDVLTQHECRRHNSRDLEIYKIAIKQWNTSKTRLKYTELPDSLCTHKNRKAFLDRYKVVAGDLPYSHTMIAHISKDGHYFIHPDLNQCRSISVREAARIQAFPDDYFFEGPRGAQFVQIGNAVPPLMAKGIALALKKSLNEKQTTYRKN
jgi:DNA (cytosine-5)-methyltransferase 1